MQQVEAVFDGTVLHPKEPIALAKGTQVRLTIEPISPIAEKPRSFLQTAKSLQLEGPTDWSSNLDQYLSDKEAHPDG